MLNRIWFYRIIGWSKGYRFRIMCIELILFNFSPSWILFGINRIEWSCNLRLNQLMILKIQIPYSAYIILFSFSFVFILSGMYGHKISVTLPLQKFPQSSKDCMPDETIFCFHCLFIVWFTTLGNSKENGRWEGKWQQWQRQRPVFKYGGVCCGAPLSSFSWISTTTIRWRISPREGTSGWVSPFRWISSGWLSSLRWTPSYSLSISRRIPPAGYPGPHHYPGIISFYCLLWWLCYLITPFVDWIWALNGEEILGKEGRWDQPPLKSD